TPLVKWYGTEGAVRVCRLALQIHGGVGVVDEYDVGRFMRDSLITPIYEGTSQIQSLMAVKDLMKWTMQRPASLVRGGPSRLLAERAARTARLVAERNRRAIALDDGSVFERIATWRSERN